MIITDRFVYIHLPKTGGSFVNAALMEAHGIKWNWWHHAVLTFSGRFTHLGPLGRLTMQDKHGPCQRIPVPDRHKPIFSTIRHPLDYYVSDFKFGWWKRNEWWKYYRKIPHFKRDYPDFPNLNFADYLQLMCCAFNPAEQNQFKNPAQLGYFSASFLKMFARNPAQLFAKLKENPGISILDELYPVHFIHTQNLNQELFQMLSGFDYPDFSIDFILKKDRILPLGKGRSISEKWEQYYPSRLLELILQKDHLLFQLFPSFDIKPGL